MNDAFIVLEGPADDYGRYRGMLTVADHQHALAEKSGSRVFVEFEADAVYASPRGRLAYVFTEAQYGALQSVMAAQLLEHPERTRLALRDLLGETGSDRLLEQLQLLGDLTDLG